MIIYLQKEFSGFADVKKGLNAFGNKVSSTMKGIGNSMSSAASSVGGAAKQLGSNISSSAKKLGGTISSTAKNVGSNISNAASNFGKGVSNAVSSAREKVGGAISSITNPGTTVKLPNGKQWTLPPTPNKVRVKSGSGMSFGRRAAIGTAAGLATAGLAYAGYRAIKNHFDKKNQPQDPRYYQQNQAGYDDRYYSERKVSIKRRTR